MSTQLRSNLFWINCLTGMLLTCLVAFSAPLISLLYGEVRLVNVAIAISSIYFLNGLAAQYRADLNRDLRFGRMATADLASTVLGLAVATAVAVTTQSYWALVLQQITAALVNLVVLIWFGRWIPGRYHRGVAVGGILKFGSGLMASQLLAYASRNADSIIIGVRLGAGALGIYDRAFRLVASPLDQLRAPSTKVALPVLARLQDDPQEFRRFILRGQRLLAHPLMLGTCLVMPAAPLVIPGLMGGQWTGVVTTFQILCIAGMGQVANYPAYWCYLATGAMWLNFRTVLFTRPLMILLFYAGSFFGIDGVAAGVSLGIIINWLVTSYWLRRLRVVPRGELFAASARAFGCYAVAGSLGTLLGATVHAEGVVQAAVGVSGTVAALGLFLFNKHFRTDTVSTLRELRDLVRGVRTRS